MYSLAEANSSTDYGVPDLPVWGGRKVAPKSTRSSNGGSVLVLNSHRRGSARIQASATSTPRDAPSESSSSVGWSDQFLRFVDAVSGRAAICSTESSADSYVAMDVRNSSNDALHMAFGEWLQSYVEKTTQREIEIWKPSLCGDKLSTRRISTKIVNDFDAREAVSIYVRPSAETLSLWPEKPSNSKPIYHLDEAERAIMKRALMKSVTVLYDL